MPDSWQNITPDRVPIVNPAAAADFNAVMANLRLLKGGTAGTAPTSTLEAVISGLASAVIDIAAIEKSGMDYIDPSGADYSLTSSGNGANLSPTSDINVGLPLNVSKGWSRKIFNRSDTYSASVITDSSDADLICKLIPKSWAIFQARVANPQNASDWAQIDAGGGWADWGGTSGSNFGAGFGTVTALNADQIQAKRASGHLKLRGRFQAGTVTTGSGVMLLPHALSIKTSHVEDAITTFGYYNMVYNSGADSPIWATDHNSGVFYYRAAAGATYIQIASHFGGGIYQNDNVSAIVASGGNIVFAELSIPIDGWQLG